MKINGCGHRVINSETVGSAGAFRTPAYSPPCDAYAILPCRIAIYRPGRATDDGIHAHGVRFPGPPTIARCARLIRLAAFISNRFRRANGTAILMPRRTSYSSEFNEILERFVDVLVSYGTLYPVHGTSVRVQSSLANAHQRRIVSNVPGAVLTPPGRSGSHFRRRSEWEIIP